ncbi:IclR family transcriptional regulator [Saccharopolyspora subtropica]|uniref:IclR family transcriptional regulator n=1 Tax=Saccharopolyspora thermophila TaxID=89367 RepID=A0A917NE43_9PSEU|nr:IclR family transcriptional regulator [Saccharopolyspora subtropica]GGI88928.1 IclR family transcriptional regulator [Saccharopolyspora subtropica]
MANPGLLQTADRALLVLLSFTDQRPEWGVSELARELGWDKSVVQRLLATLAGRGFVLAVPETRRYRLGPTVSQLARVAERSGALSLLARPVLAKLARETGESAVLNVAHGASYRTVAAVDARGPLSYSAIVGHVMPGHAGCSGHALFAGQPVQEVRELFGPEPLTRYTPNTPTTYAELRQRWQAVRDTGLSVSTGEFDANVAAAAVPVELAGATVASMTLIGPADRVTSRIDELTAPLRAAGADLAARLAPADRPSSKGCS